LHEIKECPNLCEQERGVNVNVLDEAYSETNSKREQDEDPLYNSDYINQITCERKSFIVELSFEESNKSLKAF
jgi:hypothetical protein